jgi:hypothetical protein
MHYREYVLNDYNVSIMLIFLKPVYNIDLIYQSVYKHYHTKKKKIKNVYPHLMT